MKHIFKGSIVSYNHRLGHSYSYTISGYEDGYRYHVYSSYDVTDWKVIESNDKIGFPLIAGDYVIVNNTGTRVNKTIINSDGSITCLVDIVLKTYYNEEMKEALQKTADEFNLEEIAKSRLSREVNKKPKKESLWTRFVKWFDE